ncbi:MAG: hypothetical protein AABX88_02525 [Nanoarchaeota archaeon]
MKNSEENFQKLLEGINKYYTISKEVYKKFGGPSTYFHLECIKAGKKEYLGGRHIEMLYATLTAWGMHRMGDIEKTKAKLVEFEEFKKTILDNKEKLNRLKNVSLINLDQYKEEIKDLFLNLKVSISNALIVANSKTMYHLLWDLIPPMDREHTIYFFKKNKLVPKDSEKQFDLFWEILIKIKKIILSKEFQSLNIETTNKGFFKSKPKIADDLIMTYVKEIKEKDKIA